MGRTSIEWLSRQRPDGTWTPGYTFNGWWGCVEVGPECDSCYARAFAHRLGLELWGATAPRRPASESYWRQPEAWNRKAAALREQHLVFCQSMSDVLEDRRDLDPLRARLWDLIDATPNLIWLLLTKRPSKFATLTPERWRTNGWPRNVWAGCTAGTQRTADVMVPQLLQAAAGAVVRFVSYEPALERVDFRRWLGTPWACPSCRWSGEEAAFLAFDPWSPALCPECSAELDARMERVDWIIAGSESGVRPRPADENWIRAVRDACVESAAFFYKQRTVGRAVESRPALDGRQWLEFPGGAADEGRRVGEALLPAGDGR